MENSDRNPYAPPQATVADAPGDSVLPFFPVSKTKFFIMSAVTLTLYQLYWFYKNWQRIRARTAEDLSPFWRAFFAIFFCKSLFDRVRDHAMPLVDEPISSDLLAIGWIVVVILANILARFDTAPLLLAMFTLLLVSAVFFFPVLTTIDQINQSVDPQHDRNSRFTAWNIAAVVFGVIFHALAVIGLMTEI